MGRSELDLERIDAILDALTPSVGDDPEPSDSEDAAAPSPLHAGHRARFWWADEEPPAPQHHPRREGPDTPDQRSRSPRPRYRSSARPGDLPELAVLPGYRRDPRGTWRYLLTGEAVPGARDITLDSLHRYARHRPEFVRVPDDASRIHPELAWCREIGSLVLDAGQGLAVWEFELLEWEERALWPLGLTAPELAPDRLVTVERLANFLGGVAHSTISSYLARGRLPAPQVRIGSRPAWSAPVLLQWFRRR